MKYRVYDITNKRFVTNLINQDGEVVGAGDFSVHYFTGYNDKNGTPIYTNDLVKINVIENGQLKEYKYSVMRGDSGFFILKSLNGNLLEYVKHRHFQSEVIGNLDINLTTKQKALLEEDYENQLGE